MAASSSSGITASRPPSKGKSTRLGYGPASRNVTSTCAAPTFWMSSRFTERTGGTTFKGEVDLTIRGVTRTVPLDVISLGEWKTPYWVGEENRGELLRIGFEATTKINRHDFGVSWQDEIPGGGVVVSSEIELNLDVEAILLDDLERTGAIEYYRE